MLFTSGFTMCEKIIDLFQILTTLQRSKVFETFIFEADKQNSLRSLCAFRMKSRLIGIFWKQKLFLMDIFQMYFWWENEKKIYTRREELIKWMKWNWTTIDDIKTCVQVITWCQKMAQNDSSIL